MPQACERTRRVAGREGKGNRMVRRTDIQPRSERSRGSRRFWGAQH